MTKEVLNRVSVPGKIFDLLWVDDEFYREVGGNKKISSSGKFPRCDQWCDEKGFHMAFALAGYSPDDVSINAEGSLLCISGAGGNSKPLSNLSDGTAGDSDEYPAKEPSLGVQQGIILRGIARRNFKSKFFIHPSFDLEKTTASMRNGLLEVFIPRGKEVVATNIEIKES